MKSVLIKNCSTHFFPPISEYVFSKSTPYFTSIISSVLKVFRVVVYLENPW